MKRRQSDRPDQRIYEHIFQTAYELHRVGQAAEDQWCVAVSELLFAVLNCTDRDDGYTMTDRDRLMSAAEHCSLVFKMAYSESSREDGVGD